MSNAITNTQLAIIKFWSQFGVPVYEQGQANVSSGSGMIPAPMPYITYSFPITGYGTNDIANAQVWTRQTGNSQLFGIVDKIADRIPSEGGINIPVGNGQGIVVLRRSSPFINPYPQDDPMLRVRVITVHIVNYVV